MRRRITTIALVVSAALARSTAASAQEDTTAPAPAGRLKRELAGKTVRLRDVLNTLSRNHPTAAQAEALVRQAEGALLSNEGAYDPKLKLSAKGLPLGKYAKGQVNARIEQQTPLWGASLYGGWRRNFGNFAPYDGDLETLSNGEFSAGVSVPVWRGGVIDEMRARIRKSEFGLLSARQQQRMVALLLRNAAAQAYWSWVEAGRKLEVKADLLRVAEQRLSNVRRQIETGGAAPILAVDSEQMVAGRQADLNSASGKLEQAALKLSLFLRDRYGKPIVLERDQIPRQTPDIRLPGTKRIARAVKHGIRYRPDLAMLRLKGSALGVDVDLASNAVAPQIDLQGWVAKDLGNGPDKLEPLDVGIGIKIEIPLLFRKARGKLAASRGKLAALRQKNRLARDKVEVEVRTAAVNLRVAHQNLALRRRQKRGAERMAAAERRRFELGDGDLFKVNKREQTAAKAAIEEISARIDVQRAFVDFLTAAGWSPR